jgi:hypothetical protein
MSIKINEDFMSLERNGGKITAAARLDHQWARDGLVQAPDPQRGSHGAHAR